MEVANCLVCSLMLEYVALESSEISGGGTLKTRATSTTASRRASESSASCGVADVSFQLMPSSSTPTLPAFADTTLITQAIDGAPCELAFGWALPSGESLTLTAHAVYLPRPRIEIAGPQGIQATFDWQAAKAASPDRMCTVTLVNDIEEY